MSEFKPLEDYSQFEDAAVEASRQIREYPNEAAIDLLRDLMFGVANAQLTQDKADRDKEIRAIGEWLRGDDELWALEQQGGKIVSVAQIQAFLQGDLPEGIKEGG